MDQVKSGATFGTRACAMLLLTCLAAGVARADILIGQTAGFTGPVAAGVQETTAGATLYFDAINAAGGIGGQKIKLISVDDKFDPALSAMNAEQLVTQNQVVALFLSRGTPNTEKMLPIVMQYRVPFVAPSTGAMVLHKPVNPYVFNVRSTYQREAEKAIEHLATIGMNRIAVIQVNDSFGADAVAGATAGFSNVKLQPLFSVTVDRVKPDFIAVAARIRQEQAQAVLVAASSALVADAVAAIRAAGSAAQVVTLSNNASSGFIKALGKNAHGVIVSQVFPSERSVAYPIVKEAMGLAKKRDAAVTPSMLEGFAGAKVLVEGLRRAKQPITRETLQTALAGLSKLDLGGMEMGYSATDRTGLEFVDLSIIGSDGKFKR